MTYMPTITSPAIGIKTPNEIIEGFRIRQDTLDHLPTPFHKRVAQKLIAEGTWILVPETKD